MQPRQFWSALGVDSFEEELYARMVAAPGLGLTSYARDLGCSTPRARGAALRLTQLGLVRRSGHRFEPIEPRTAVTTLARARQALLDHAGMVAGDLASTYAAARLNAEPDGLIDVLGSEEIGARLAEMILGASHSVDATAAPPYSPSTNPTIEAAEEAALERGVRFRAIYDAAVLEDATQLDNVAAATRRGEQARTRPGLSTKMIIIDREQALLPLAHRPVDGRIHAVVISRSSLSAALVTLFELLWDGASALRLPESSPPVTEAGRQVDARLLALLGTGMSDQAISRQLKISDRTLRRRIDVLQHQFAVKNRFQLGAAAAWRGLLD